MWISCSSILIHFPNTYLPGRKCCSELFVSGRVCQLQTLSRVGRRETSGQAGSPDPLITLHTKGEVLYSGCAAFLFISILKKVNSSSPTHICFFFFFLKSGITSESIPLLLGISSQLGHLVTCSVLSKRYCVIWYFVVWFCLFVWGEIQMESSVWEPARMKVEGL